MRPRPCSKLLDTHLDLARLVRVTSGEVNEPISESELRRLENATPAQARALLATEGYMAAQVRTQRETAEGADARPRVRVIVEPGVRTQVSGVTLQVSGPLGEEAASGDSAAQSLVDQWRGAWTLPAGRRVLQRRLARRQEQRAGALARRGLCRGDLAEHGRRCRCRQRPRHARAHRGLRPALSCRRDGDRGARTAGREERAQPRRLFSRRGHHRTALARLPGAAAALGPVRGRLGDGRRRPGAGRRRDRSPCACAKRRCSRPRSASACRANSGARVSVEHVHRNIGGLRATLRNKLEWGTKRSLYEGELASHALEGLYRNLLGGAWESVESDTDRVYSARVRLGRAYETQRHERLWFVQGEQVRVRPFDTSTAASASTRTDTTSATLNFHGTWRDLDSIVLPTRGVSLAFESGAGRVFSADASGPVQPKSGPFARLHVRAQWWQPFGDRWYAQARIEAGQVFARDAVEVPETQRFRAGGDDSVRGYAWRSLAPQVGGVDVGGRVVATGSVEIARPVSEKLPSVWWAAFVDAGRAAESWNDFSPAWGAGVGVRWRSPVGPLRADIAYGDEEQRWRLHFSVGIAF